MFVMVTRANCIYCKVATSIFERNDLPFVSVDVDNPKDLGQHAIIDGFKESGHTTYPYITCVGPDGVVVEIGGSVELMSYVQRLQESKEGRHDTSGEPPRDDSD